MRSCDVYLCCHAFSFAADVPSSRRSSASESENRFVETTLTYALSYASSLYGAAIRPATFTILADTEYYSRSGRAGTSWQSSRFHNFDLPIHEVHKTGLGSSAALVTAFATAAIAYFVPLTLQDADTKEGQQRLHNLAQAAHCAAQGKIGSGFDVAAAVYGSCVYRRFSPKILEKLGNPNDSDFAPKLRSVVDDTDLFGKWDASIDKKAAIIPKGMLLVMCDVDCGSQTVGMVKTVLQWREQQRNESTLLWASLQAANEDFAEQLRSLAKTPLLPTEALDRLKKSILTIRSLLRAMSREAGAPIEPPVQTALIDACSSLPGVIGGVVPGAGGYDAIALLIEDKADVVRDLRALLAEYASSSKDEDGVRIGNLRLLGVKQDSEGLYIEDADEYEPWLRR